MPKLSVIIPAYNNSHDLPECVHSILSQDFKDIEVIIVDDASTDDTSETIKTLSQSDSRIISIRHEVNQGTLGARTTGVSSSRGQFVMFMDQDDALAPGSLTKLIEEVHQHPADIYHFGVLVEAANSMALQASAGMTSFLTPKPRTLHGIDILQMQFSENAGFDWHLHHKLFRGELLRSAYQLAADTRLQLSDDLYMNFIIDSIAQSYIAIPDSPWYIYHLGRGDTFGSKLTLAALRRLTQRDAKAFQLIKQFVTSTKSPIREDWKDRVSDVRTRLIEHTMNEWKDNLAAETKQAGLDDILRYWAPDVVAGELYRYVRDYAYDYLQQSNKHSPVADADRSWAVFYLTEVQRIAQRPEFTDSPNQRYTDMKAIAEQHLHDAELLPHSPKKRRNRTLTLLHKVFH